MRAIERGGPWKSRLFWALKWHRRSECHLGQKSWDVAPFKIITYRAIKTTGSLVILCTRVLLFSVVVCKRGGEVYLQLFCVRRYSGGGGVVGSAFLTPGFGIWDPGWVESQHPDPGSGIRDEQLRSYFLELRNHFFVFFGLKYLNSLMRIRTLSRSFCAKSSRKIRILVCFPEKIHAFKLI
jgi:hypothetical protein